MQEHTAKQHDTALNIERNTAYSSVIGLQTAQISTQSRMYEAMKKTHWRSMTWERMARDRRLCEGLWRLSQRNESKDKQQRSQRYASLFNRSWNNA